VFLCRALPLPQVTDLNDIEPWTGGKPEFTIVVMNANGVIIGNKNF
jgi:hypothetical protein